MAETRGRYIRKCEQAAEKGRPQALYDLGLVYATGQGVEVNYVLAHKWFNLAAIRGIQRARIDRAELAEAMTDGDIAEAQRLAREWQLSHPVH